jgi:quercetin dioxygenase-like cupin family protein
MNVFPSFIDQLPAVDIGVPGVVVRVLIGTQSVAFIAVLEDASVSPHRHGAQWGIVVSGAVELTIEGEVRTYVAGDSYHISAGLEHGAKLLAGSRLIEVFEDRDRFSPSSSDDPAAIGA